MAITLTELQAQRDAILRAMATGALSVQTGDSRIQYRNMAEMQQALSVINSQIAGYDTTTRVRMVRVNTRDGG